MARPERFELPTLCFEGRCSIQLSYGRVGIFYPESRVEELSHHRTSNKFVRGIGSGAFEDCSYARIRGAMEKAGKILGRALRRIERPEAAIAWLRAEWPRVVGKTLASHTHPLRCEHGRLEISTDSKSWQSQVEGLKRDLCSRINQAWGRTLVREVEVVAAKPGPQRIPRELDLTHTPFVRRRKY